MLNRNDSKSRFGAVLIAGCFLAAGTASAKPEKVGALAEPVDVTLQQCLDAVENGAFLGQDREGATLYLRNELLFFVLISDRQVACHGSKFVERTE